MLAKKIPAINNAGVGSALLAAALFGASTPLAKQLVGQMPPITLAAILYLGAGIGLLGWFVLGSIVADRKTLREAGLASKDLPWLAGVILSGGVAAPVLLMTGLATTPASSASLLLNLEMVFTALIAWWIFKENRDRRVITGMLCMVAGGTLLSWEGIAAVGIPWGSLAIAAACLCWAIDNNLTRHIATSDPVQIAGIKGLVAGTVNLVIALTLGSALPDWRLALIAGTVGWLGYGLSLMLFVLALRHIGTARTGAYFSLAPFIGVAVSLLLLGEHPGGQFWTAALLMATGIWLHLTERHEHSHLHEAIHHAHRHRHDEHHQHLHEGLCNGAEPHSHDHRHPAFRHRHAHYPDTHHRHDH